MSYIKWLVISMLLLLCYTLMIAYHFFFLDNENTSTSIIIKEILNVLINQQVYSWKMLHFVHSCHNLVWWPFSWLCVDVKLWLLCRSPDSQVWDHRKWLAPHQAEYWFQMSHRLAQTSAGHAIVCKSLSWKGPSIICQHHQPHGRAGQWWWLP